jgi:hypothetical protein
MFFTLKQKQEIEKAVEFELLHHPKASLKDIYKNFFQDQFGPGHLISNPEKAFEYLQNEVTESLIFDDLDFHYLGYENRFVRVNLKLVKENIIPIEDFFQIFLDSATKIVAIPIEEWHEKWKNILLILNNMRLNISDFEENSLQIEKNLSDGIYVGHHSNEYEKLYHPQYRIINAGNSLKIKSLYNS